MPAITKHSIRLQGFSPEQLLDVVRGARLEHYILTGSKCHAHLDRWGMGNFGVDIGYYNFPVRVIGAFSPKRFCIGYMRRITDSTWVNGFTADQGTMEFYPAGAELNYRAAPDSVWVAIEFDEEILQSAACAQLGREVNLPSEHVVSFRVTKAERNRIDRMVENLWRHPISGALMVQPILGAIAELFDGLRHKRCAIRQRKLVRTQILLRQADEYLRANFANHFDLRALADAAGTTERTLERTFANAYGVTPQRWARCFALHHARERLRAANWQVFTVEGIANECGFHHMGRFAEYYRDLFGELPSTTLSL